MTMCAKSFPCDEFEWLTEFVEYQTSEHQAKIKFAQGHKAVVKEGKQVVSTDALCLSPLRGGSSANLGPRALSYPSLRSERETTGRRENLGTRLFLAPFSSLPQPSYDIKRSVRRVMGSWPLC